MKTSIFDMNFTLPPLIEMHEVTKDMDSTWSLILGTLCMNFTLNTRRPTWNIYL